LDDNQLAQIAKFHGGWTRRRGKDYFFDAFWQYAHIALLQWLQNPSAHSRQKPKQPLIDA